MMAHERRNHPPLLAKNLMVHQRSHDSIGEEPFVGMNSVADWVETCQNARSVVTKCPVCLQTVKESPMYVCVNSREHSLCMKCYDPLEDEERPCPICQGRIVKALHEHDGSPAIEPGLAETRDENEASQQEKTSQIAAIAEKIGPYVELHNEGEVKEEELGFIKQKCAEKIHSKSMGRVLKSEEIEKMIRKFLKREKRKMRFQYVLAPQPSEPQS